ncbi:MAG TPA: hypothetical protein VM695_16835 [Phycisphaerae bacterium]|nr:hypothetical protein [Phycisphaerae bacterium]
MTAKRTAGLAAGLLGLALAGAEGAEGRKVRQIKVLADKAPDCSTLESIVQSITRGCQTNDEKAIAIYNFSRLAWYHRQYPGEKGGVAALKMLHVYGWSLCGGQHAVLSALWRAAGWKWRFVGWKGHTTVEAFYDEKWHYFDTFLKVYVWKDDPTAPGGRTVASQADIAANPQLISEGLVFDKARNVYYPKGNRFEIINDQANWQAPAFLVCGDEPQGVLSGVQGRRDAGPATGWMGIKHDSAGYTTDVDLAPGESLELDFSAVPGAHWWNGRKYIPGHTCGDKDYRNCPAIGPVLEPYRALSDRGARTYSSGRLLFAPDLRNDAFLSGLAASENVKLDAGRLVPAETSKPASITVELASPYVMSRASGAAAGATGAEVSTDGGKTFQPIDLKDFSDAVGGQYAALVRVAFDKALSALRLEAIVQHNRCVLPYLSPGRNEVTVSVADAKQLGDHRLAVTYAYCLGSRSRSYEDMADRGAEAARAHYAEWSQTPTVVRKVFRAGDLPATFTIDVPTPKGKHPVYPRMLLLRREVLAPGTEPQPLPEGAVEAKAAPTDEIQTLPNPFLVGIALPPKKVERPTAVRKLPLFCSHVVKTDGQVFDNNFLKWRPKEVEAWVMLVGGELKPLPAPRDIVAARLCFPVVNGCPQATTQVGCTLLEAPFEKGKPYDFKKLGEVQGTVNVPKQAAAGEAKYYRIDVTRGVKGIAAGEAKYHGFCIRTVPNRSVDDGWTTRIDLTKDKVTYLELETYAR